MSRRKNISALGLIFVLIAVSAALTIGVAWGRFRTELTGNIHFQNRQPAEICLYGGKDDTGYIDLPDQWTVTESGAGSSLSLLVTNGTIEKYAQNDVNFYLRLATTDGIGDAENLKISLYVNTIDGAVSAYDAVAQAISQDTQMYEQFGSGWVYRFYDTDGNEAEFSLPGGALSEYSAVLVCNKVNLGADPNLLQLQVIARDN